MKADALPPVVWMSDSADATFQWGVRLGEIVPPGAVIVLSGPLGAGKTTFVQGVAVGLGVQELPTSPTFVLAVPYQGARGKLYHVDAYRLQSLAEADALGLDEWVEAGARLVVEWGERITAALPPVSLTIEIDWVAEHGRRIQLAPATAAVRELLQRISANPPPSSPSPGGSRNEPP